MTSKILVVDDEESIVKLVSFNLNKEGFQTVAAGDGNEAWEKIQQEKPDLIVLDVMLPGMDGLTLCRLMRKEGLTTPILMLTARDEEIDKVLGLEMGADDYLTKPFSPRELVARVRAILRRTGEREREGEEHLEFGELEVFPARYEVRLAGETVALTPKEFELLLLLCRSAGLVLSREYILQKLWGYDFYGDARVVDVHISHLREKLEQDPAHPRYIKTVRGVGYKFQSPIQGNRGIENCTG
ncbi:MAG TPA: response regulator transcription factor [Syntrophomonadaceae bacterium]|nr:response regulator transcription factor [Syntrophomonadaceae bacterium]